MRARAPWPRFSPRSRSMHQGQLVFAQLMRHLPLTTFRRCVARYDGEHKVKRFSCLDQYLCMAFAQLTYRESLRDIEASLRAQSPKLYHLGIRGNVARNTLANANATRDWRIYASFAERLIGIARGLYAEDPFGCQFQQTCATPPANRLRFQLTAAHGAAGGGKSSSSQPTQQASL